MVYKCRCLAFIMGVIFLFVLRSSGQDRNLISGNFSSITFDQFVQEVETKTSYHFFYIPTQFDSISVNLNVTDKPLSSVLETIFQGTDFHYTIDDQNQVFVVKRLKIETALPADFFNHQRNQADTSKVDEFYDAAAAATEAQNEKIKSSLENKLYTIGVKTNTVLPGSATVAGYIRDANTGESITGAAVYIDNPPIGVATDKFGYFSFTLPRGRHVLRISSVGMKDTKRQIMLYTDGKLNVDLYEFIASLKVVTVISEKNSNIKRMQMGVERLNIKTIKQVPVVFGEPDVLRAVLALPGVTSVGEASTGLNVRGGSADQNLVLFSDATIFNASHFFGFFSSFNPDAVKDVQLYKSSVPEKYGGRLSSVLDVTTPDGNQKKISGSGGIGILTTRLSIDGPLFNDKTTFAIGGRTTYSDWILKTIPNQDYSQSTANFYDLNLHLTHEIDAKNSLYLTGYYSNDRFKLNSDTLYQYANKNFNLKWKHNFNNKFYGVLTGGYDGYSYNVSSNYNAVNAFKLGFSINQTFLKADFNYNLNSRNSIDFGLSSIYWKLYPGSYQPMGQASLVVPTTLAPEQALESAAYLGDNFILSPRISINAGIRYSYYNYLGPQQVYTYAPGQPLEQANVTDSTYYGKGKVIQTYHSPEYRASIRYILSENSSLKASYNTLTQYIHVLTNTAAISPTDVWQLSDPYIKPLYGDQFSVGYYQNFKSNTIETSVEVYYKQIQNYLDYKSGAVLVMNPHIEQAVITDRGTAYGIELMIKKTAGKLNGWMSYTYSRTLLQQDDPIAGETINNGDYYPANYDKPNAFNFIGNYKVNHRLSFSLDVIYSTGVPITLPVAIYNLGGAQRVYYSERNQYRTPDYFRTDVAINIEGNHKIKKFKHSSWTIGVYNVTGRKNPYSIYFIEQNGVVKGYQLSIFGVPIPSITYNFRF
jgi:hypothetical protein